MENLENRYNAVMKRLPVPVLMSLPEQIKELLKATTDFKAKVELLESIADALAEV